MDKKTGILDLTLSKRTELIKLLLAACILAMGTSLIANFLTEYFKAKMIVSLILGGILIIVVVVYFIYTIISEAEKEIEIEGLIAIEKKSKNVCPILRYEFSENLADTMSAVFLENEALKQYWEEDFKNKKTNDEKKEKVNNNSESNEQKKEDTGYYAIIRVIDDKSSKEKKKADKILEETVEYLIIEQLSMHLSTYFNNYGQDKFIKEYTRTDFPEILLQNRIVNLLSTPFEDRAIFVKAGMTKNPPEGEIISIYGNDGSRFTRFDLVLPKGSTIKRPSDGILTVENNRIFLQIEIKYGGFASALPKGFEQNYLGLDIRDLDTRKLDITLRYKIKPLALFYRSKWNYHNWVDSFAERLIEYLSFGTFVHNVNWEANLTSIITANQRRRILKERSETENAKTENNDTVSNN
ncbi:hypothetical protein AD998_18725 [bacterium 336/3]|nr:hypothetical protein AD998_18725 [bacterium 336/3]